MVISDDNVLLIIRFLQKIHSNRKLSTYNFVEIYYNFPRGAENAGDYKLQRMESREESNARR